MFFRSRIILFTFTAFLLGPAVPKKGFAFNHSHAAFQKVLQAYVKGGMVDYGGLKKNRKGLDDYAKELAAVTPKALKTFNDAQTQAFWINAYNALTLKLLIDHGPVKSIRDIDGAWDKKTFQVAGRALTLNAIEHDILRKDFTEPRVHSVLVCAAKSCPILESNVYLPKTLNARLDGASVRFAKSKSRNHFDQKKNTAHVSKIFQWYGQDFSPTYGKDKNAGIIGFLNRFGDVEIPANATLDWTEYDWSLNGSW